MPFVCLLHESGSLRLVMSKWDQIHLGIDLVTQDYLYVIRYDFLKLQMRSALKCIVF